MPEEFQRAELQLVGRSAVIHSPAETSVGSRKMIEKASRNRFRNRMAPHHGRTHINAGAQSGENAVAAGHETVIARVSAAGREMVGAGAGYDQQIERALHLRAFGR